MKPLKLLTLISFTLCFCHSLSWAQAVLDDECHMEIGESEMAALTAGRLYYNIFKVDGKMGRVNLLEFNLVMEEGKTYHFNIRSAHGDANGIVMKIYDRKTKTRLLTNFSEGGLSTDLSYKCPSTGIYDVKFSFRGSKDYCGVCICTYTPKS